MRNGSLFVLVALIATGPLGTTSEEDSTSRLWIRILDQQGNPIAARIYLRSERGDFYIPQGSIGRGRRERFFHARGQFQTVLPPGKYTVEAVKGFEYEPVTKNLNLSFIELNDRTTTETITLKRLVDMPALGWYSGDVHMHPNHREGGLYMTMEDCELLAAGEDIRVANLLISNRQYTARVFDTEFFRDGEVDPASSTEAMMVVQEEFRNTSDMYGHMPLLGIKRLVEPFFSGERPYWEDYPPNYSTAKRVQEMGGVVSYAHPSNQLGVLLGPHQAREFPIDLALGVVNALDVLSNADEAATSHLYYRVLNAGLRCTASAGTDTQMDVPDNSSIPGGGRVYVKVDPPLTYAKWIEGYRAGRTFVSNGPMLFLNVDGKGPGDEIRLTGPRRITVSAEARSIPPMKALELIVNGEVAATATPTAEGTAAKLSHTLQADESAWVAARVTGPAHRRVMNDSQLFAHTSPVYLVRDGKPVAIAKDAAIVLGWIDRLIEDVKKSPRFAKDAHRQEVLEIFQRGRRHYEKIASAK
jgi:TolB protein